MDYSDQHPLPDPSDFSLNGELATSEELRALEALACELLESAPTEIYYEYGYGTDDDLVILFGTVESETSQGTTHRARISMNQSDYDNPFFLP